MQHAVTLLLILLTLSLVLFVVKRGRPAKVVRLFRLFSVLLGLAFFGWWFAQRSFTDTFADNSLALQVVNRLPQTVDFYTVSVFENGKNKAYEAAHLGKIRTDYYRIGYMKVADSGQFWIAGFLGKNKLVYFSQHRVLNHTEDQLVEVRNYINQSMKLSATAEREVSALKSENISSGSSVALAMLLLFLNIALLFRRKNVI